MAPPGSPKTVSTPMASSDLTSDWAPVQGSGTAGTAGAAGALGRCRFWAARSAGDAFVDVRLSVTVFTTSSLRRTCELMPVGFSSHEKALQSTGRTEGRARDYRGVTRAC